MAVKPIPEGYHSLTPYLAVPDAARAIDFYQQSTRRRGDDPDAGA